MSNKTNKKGFTMIELLVIVLIIGILAGIALPQYRMSLLKAEYSTLKAKTKAIAEAVNTYQNETGSLPASFQSLYISFDNVQSYGVGDPENDWGVRIRFKNGEECSIYYKNKNYGNEYVACLKPFRGKNMGYYYSLSKLKPLYCIHYHSLPILETLCKHETGKNKPSYTNNSAGYSLYSY